MSRVVTFHISGEGSRRMHVDMAALEQFYRIIAFFVLGFILLAVARRYQKAFQVKEPSK